MSLEAKQNDRAAPAGSKETDNDLDAEAAASRAGPGRAEWAARQAGAAASTPRVELRGDRGDDGGQAPAEGRDRTEAKAKDDPAARRSEPPPPVLTDEEEEAPPNRFRTFVVSLGKTVATLVILGLAILAGLVIWDYYVTAPWTRDGRIRVQVASIAPQVSGQIAEVRVRDNQFIHKGDVLYVIDPFDFERELESAKANLRMRAADLEVKKAKAERRQKLSQAAASVEEQQQYVGDAAQAQAAYDGAQQDVDQSEINLKRTKVLSPVNGYVTNLLMRVGDYAKEASSNISVIDVDSYWIDGYFEETKMAHVCVGDRAEAQLMGYRQPILGTVATVTRGISVSNAEPSTQGLPEVDPVYTWVRLAQRVPVRIAITQVPPGVPLVSGLTATVTIREPAPADERPWYRQRWDSLHQRIDDVFYRPQPSPRCVPPVDSDEGVSQKIGVPKPPAPQDPNKVEPGIAPGITAKPLPDQ